MLYLICKRAKPVRRSSPIVVYIEGFPATGNPPGYAPDLWVVSMTKPATAASEQAPNLVGGATNPALARVSCTN